MKSKNSSRLIVVLVVLLLSLFYTLPSTGLWVKAFGIISPDEQLAVPQRLLQYSNDGGAALLTLQLDKMAPMFNRSKNPAKPSDVLENVADTIRATLVKLGYKAGVTDLDYAKGNAFIKVNDKTDQELKVILETSNLYASLPLMLANVFPRSRITLGLDLKGGIDLVYQVDTSSLQEGDTITDAVTRSVEIIRNRIDMYGIAEPSIKAQQENRIRIQLPGVKDTERVKQLIQNTAMLQFHMVLDQAATAAQLEPIDTESEIVLMMQGSVQQASTWLKLKKKPEISGRDLKYAKVSFDDMSAPVVHLEFNADGAAKFAQVTGAHVGEQLAIVLDRKVHSAPVIQQRITGGQAQITGHFSLEEAKNLAIVLRAGALPANLIALESQVVGPTLGQKSIDAGWRAGVVGIILVMLYMLYCYRMCGLFADLAVLFNTLIIVAVLVFFGGTLTLAGIAGLILTVGMAVDANVIIFERIIEEYRSGKTVRAAINAGFDRALSCVVDSNITTLLTVAILYIFATGPIRGFATTLGIGLIANVYTAVIFVKLLLDLYYGGSKDRKLSIGAER